MVVLNGSAEQRLIQIWKIFAPNQLALPPKLKEALQLIAQMPVKIAKHRVLADALQILDLLQKVEEQAERR